MAASSPQEPEDGGNLDHIEQTAHHGKYHNGKFKLFKTNLRSCDRARAIANAGRSRVLFLYLLQPPFPTGLPALRDPDGYNPVRREGRAMSNKAQTIAPSSSRVWRAGRNSEIKLGQLSPEDRKKFDLSMEKEWNSWQKFGAVEKLSEEQGCQEDPHDIRSDSPTASLLAFNLVCSIATMMNWVIAACDASTAYPQFDLRNKGRRKGMVEKAVENLEKKHSWQMSKIQMSKIAAALFFLFDGIKLLGVMISHVDDLYSAGEGKKYNDTIAEMEGEGCIALDQYDAIEGVDYMVLDASRRKQPNAPLSEPEKSLFRGLIGQMGWITRQTRPDLMVNVSMAMAAQSMGSPTVKDVINLNKAVKMLRESSDAKWCFRASHLSLQNSIVFCFADSSFANQPEVPDRVLDRLTTPEIHEGKKAPIHVIETYFGSIKRVCRSTLAAEANRFLAGAKIACLIDAKSLESTLNRSTWQPQDKRVRILVAQVKELLGEDEFEDEVSAFAY
eukprot:s1781_g2.t1